MNATSNPTLGLAHMLSNADAVIWLTAIVLLVMSVISWTLIIAKGRASQRLRQQIAADAERFWQASSLETGLQQLQSSESAAVLAPMAHAAAEMQRAGQAASLDGQSDWEDRVTRRLRSTRHAILPVGLAI